MRIRVKWVSIVFLCVTLAAAMQHDSATIVNSGSTNTAGYTITLWSDGTATVQVRGAQAKPFTIPAKTASRFFTDVKAASGDGGGQLQHCMKSASFGTSTIVQWHGWTSPDFQCPPFTPAVTALAQDVNAIQTAADIMPGRPLHRIGLPGDLRKIPSPTPEVQPT
jgi:hypothetical protein